MRVNSALSGGLNMPLANTDNEHNSEIDLSGEFFQQLNSHMSMKTEILIGPTFRCNFRECRWFM